MCRCIDWVGGKKVYFKPYKVAYRSGKGRTSRKKDYQSKFKSYRVQFIV